MVGVLTDQLTENLLCGQRETDGVDTDHGTKRKVQAMEKLIHKFDIKLNDLGLEV
jgi:hypothetical protein